jgi:hypothetical protein
MITLSLITLSGFHCNTILLIHDTTRFMSFLNRGGIVILVVKHFLIDMIKEFAQPKMSLNNRVFLISKERGKRAGQQAGIFKVRFGEIEGREIERHRFV